jgi:hypothetical protein
MLEFAQRHVASFDAACNAMVQDMCAGPKRTQKQKEWLQAPVVPDM